MTNRTHGSDRQNQTIKAIIIAILTVSLVAAAHPVGGSEAGGKVQNAEPLILSFASDPASPAEGTTGVLYGTVRDTNGESDFTRLKIALGNAPGGIKNFASDADLSAIPSTEPASYTDDWKVWDRTADDGRLDFKFRYAYAADLSGTYEWELEVEDEGGSDGATLEVTVSQRITVADAPVDAAGEPVAGAWGNWNSVPGATNVGATNYLKVQNAGSNAAQQFLLDFSAAPGYANKSFVGATDASWEIDIEENIQFAYWEGGAGDAPEDGTFTFGTTSADGAATFTFSGLEKVIYITYRLPALPEVLAEQDYGASYTINPL